MKFRVFTICSFISLSFFAPTLSFAGRYVSGVEGVKAASLPSSGLYFRSYNLHYRSDSLVDNQGNDTGVPLRLSVSASANRLIWVTEKKFLGGTYFNDIVVPLVYVDFELDRGAIGSSEAGIGDLYIEPLGLAWHTDSWDTAIAAGVYLENGDFEATRPVNVGSGYTTYMLTAGATRFFGNNNKGSISVLARYETHEQQEQTGISYGDDFHFEYGVGYALNNGFEVGIAGYLERQIEEDEGENAVNGKRNVFAIGPEASKFFPQYNFIVSLRSLSEIHAENGTKGSIATLTLTKIM